MPHDSALWACFWATFFVPLSASILLETVFIRSTNSRPLWSEHNKTYYICKLLVENTETPQVWFQWFVTKKLTSLPGVEPGIFRCDQSNHRRRTPCHWATRNLNEFLRQFILGEVQVQSNNIIGCFFRIGELVLRMEPKIAKLQYRE